MPRVHRLVIGIFGRTNAGKSTLMNLLTGQDTSIVDPTPGTTADIKSAVMEIHGLGPVRILDTAGLDEGMELGKKKRRKTLEALEEADLCILVVDPVTAFLSDGMDVESFVASTCRRLGKNICVVFNVRKDTAASLSSEGATLDEVVEFCRSSLLDMSGIPYALLDLSRKSEAPALVRFIKDSRPREKVPPPLLPFVNDRRPVLLHIPLDEESPTGRLLRPQEMAMEYLLRLQVPVGLYRTDLKLARSGAAHLADAEKTRFEDFMNSLDRCGGVRLVLTDSQAVDIMDPWVPERIPLTTFSIMMIHQTSGGNLGLFAKGAETLNGLSAGDRILIAEACNHDRIAEDIGTVQIPDKLRAAIPGISVEHAFGREFPPPEELARFSLVIHCGGCMISLQKLSARVARLAEAGVPVTNYGMVLAWLESPDTLKRVLEPWKELL